MQGNKLQQKSYIVCEVAKKILQSDFFGHVYCLFFLYCYDARQGQKMKNWKKAIAAISMLAGIAFSAQAEMVSGEEMLKNIYFTDGIDEWTLYQGNYNFNTSFLTANQNAITEEQEYAVLGNQSNYFLFGQEITDLNTALVDNGHMMFDAQVGMNSTNNNDPARMLVRFLDENGDEISTVATGQYRRYQWTRSALDGYVPEGTRTIVMMFESTKLSGNYNSSAFFNPSLVIGADSDEAVESFGLASLTAQQAALVSAPASLAGLLMFCGLVRLNGRSARIKVS